MSLERAALRMAAAMALSNACVAPYPTIAANRVFDSRMDPLEGLEEADLVPTIIVSTDDSTGEALSQNNGGGPWRETVDLIVVCSIGVVVDASDDEEESPDLVIVTIESQPEHEAMLDLFEHQVRRCFARENQNAWTQRFWADHANRFVALSSRRFVEREAGVRLAMREIRFSVEMHQPRDEAIFAPDEGAAAIPEPMNGLLAAVVATGGDYAPTAQAIQAALEEHGGFAPLELPPLESVRFKEGDLGGGKRPDGVAEAELPAFND